MGWGVAFLDADLDGRLDLFFANGHIFADIDDYPRSRRPSAQKNQLLLNQGTTVPRRVGPRGRRPADRDVSAAVLPWAISTTTATSTSW